MTEAAAHAGAGAPPTRAGAARATTGERAAAAFLGAGCLAVLVTAASLRPAPGGMGTHTQLGLAPCGWLITMDLPCPTCGMTTAFAATVGGSYLDALRAQPFGMVLALLTATGFWGCLHTAVFGSRLSQIAGTLLRPRIVWAMAALWGAAWAYKIAAVYCG